MRLVMYGFEETPYKYQESHTVVAQAKVHNWKI